MTSSWPAISVLFLLLSLPGALLTFNAVWRIGRPRFLILPMFFAAWLTNELALHHIFWQALITAWFVRHGVLAHWTGMLGLALTLASWLGLCVIAYRARTTEGVLEDALVKTFGADYRDRIHDDVPAANATPVSLMGFLVPFRMSHSHVERVANISYGPAGRRNTLDLYRRHDSPRGDLAGPGAPMLLQVHGGAWIIGNKEQQGMPLVQHLAARGWVCVAINYRLSPRATFPDHLIDVKRAIAWMREHAREYGGNPDFIAITGGSAGGHLSAMAALTPGDPEYQPGFEHVDTRLAACVPLYAIYDFTNRNNVHHRGLGALLERAVFKTRFADHPEVFERASPMSRINAEAPPFFSIHGMADSLAPIADAAHFVKLLGDVSHEAVAYAALPYAEHAFEVFTSVRSVHAVQAIERFLGLVYSDWLAARAAEVGEVPAVASARAAAQ